MVDKARFERVTTKYWSWTRLYHNPEQNFETEFLIFILNQSGTAELSHSKSKSFKFRFQTLHFRLGLSTLELDLGIGLWTRTWTWIVTIFIFLTISEIQGTGECCDDEQKDTE